MSDVELVAKEDCTVGEGPLWHPDESCLYWIDIPAGRLYRYDPAAGTNACVHENDRPIGGYTIQTDGSLLLFEGGGRIERWESGEGIVETVVEGVDAEADSRFNDVVTDPMGRVFAGTMPTDDHSGRLYRLDRDGSLSRVDEGHDIPNGMGFSLDKSTMYLAVSDDFVIHAYDYDEDTGALSNRRTFVDTSEEPGVPDGLTVDAEDYVWCARWDDHAVDRYAPDGTHDRRIEVAPPKASSITFGGPEYHDLYITTAVGEGDEADDHPEAGSLYRITTDVKGVPEYRSRIGIEG